ncbi:glycosyltransferase family 4 protein [Nostoc sp. NIES-2111]
MLDELRTSPGQVREADASRSRDAAQSVEPILSQTYLIVTQVPYFVDEAGRIWVERLWYRDLIEHLHFIPKLKLIGPMVSNTDFPDLVQLSPEEQAQIEFFPMPVFPTVKKAILTLPKTLYWLWKAIGSADIVQSGIQGWPIPAGWFANPIALMRGKKLFLFIESAPWRIAPGMTADWKDYIRYAVTEYIGRFFVRIAHLTQFTQDSYQATLAGPKTRSFVLPASWVYDDEVITDDELARVWAAKAPRTGADVKFIFAARLTVAKGVRVLLDAVDALDKAGVRCHVDIIGTGPELEECRARFARLTSVQGRVLDPVPYGQPFFELLRQYHGVLICNLGDEQPRIEFDDCSQGVPVIASDTDGLRPHVVQGETGWLVPKNDPGRLAAEIKAILADPESLRTRGDASLALAKSMTHQTMHRLRTARLIAEFDHGMPTPSPS